jgi:hypothetical protein
MFANLGFHNSLHHIPRCFASPIYVNFMCFPHNSFKSHRKRQQYSQFLCWKTIWTNHLGCWIWYSCCLWTMLVCFGFQLSSLHIFKDVAYNVNNNISSSVYQMPHTTQGKHWVVSSTQYKVVGNNVPIHLHKTILMGQELLYLWSKQQLWVERQSKKFKILIFIVNSIHFSIFYVHWFIWFVIKKRATSPTTKYHIMSRPWFICFFVANVFSNHIAPFHVAHKCSLVVESPLHNVINRTYF